MDEQYISGVHNYCDRWCERCPFTARCRVYVMDQELPEEVNDPMDPAFWQHIKKSFEDVLEVLDRMIDDMEVDPEMQEELPDRQPNPDLQALDKIMREQTMYYAQTVTAFFQSNALDTGNPTIRSQIENGQPVSVEDRQYLEDAVAIIQWYQFFIAAKVHRAVSGMEYQEAFEDPVQSDANGSAKVAMLAIEKSLGAWEVLGRQLPPKRPYITDLQLQLQHLQAELLKLFPNWKAFHRPGFDDETQNNVLMDFSSN